MAENQKPRLVRQRKPDLMRQIRDSQEVNATNQLQKKTKKVQMSIKMGPELREQFMTAATALHRPAAQIVRDLMRSFIVCQEMPNADTIAAIQAVESGEFITHASTADLYASLSSDDFL